MFNGIYVVECLVRILAYRNTLEHILVINRINVMYVVKDVVIIVTYRHTLEHVLVLTNNISSRELLYRLHMHNIYISYTNMPVITHSMKIIQYGKRTESHRTKSHNLYFLLWRTKSHNMYTPRFMNGM